MDYQWMDDYCMDKLGVEKEYKHEWGATIYRVGGKIFALKGEDKEGKPIYTIKLEPDFGEFIRKQYDDIIPGYHMNKRHWNSIYLNGKVPKELLMEMFDQSYKLVFQGLTKKLQKEMMG